jgi:hypothetical protein
VRNVSSLDARKPWWASPDKGDSMRGRQEGTRHTNATPAPYGLLYRRPTPRPLSIIFCAETEDLHTVIHAIYRSLFTMPVS